MVLHPPTAGLKHTPRVNDDFRTCRDEAHQRSSGNLHKLWEGAEKRTSRRESASAPHLKGEDNSSHIDSQSVATHNV